MARLHFSAQDYEDAELYLLKSIQLKRDDPEFYTALADTYELLGDKKEAIKMRKLASRVKPMDRRYRGEQTRWNSVVSRVNRGL